MGHEAPRQPERSALRGRKMEDPYASHPRTRSQGQEPVRPVPEGITLPEVTVSEVTPEDTQGNPGAPTVEEGRRGKPPRKLLKTKVTRKRRHRERWLAARAAESQLPPEEDIPAEGVGQEAPEGPGTPTREVRCLVVVPEWPEPGHMVQDRDMEVPIPTKMTLTRAIKYSSLH